MNTIERNLRRLGRSALAMAILAMALLFLLVALRMIRPLWRDQHHRTGGASQ